ncbi:MAG: hypothetical protein LQ343_004416 [Gyalolechia ehrenbergii]|nr:MAG: hypothetical protein LQ343_004416 [Gyalolechia ehrenbergii]
MPIKWTPEKDQTLLLKILETSSISADVKAISETWPAGEEAPTPRAIQERLHKIRAIAKGKGTGNFKMVGTVGSKASSAKSSPAKATPRSTPKKNGKVTPGKRKRKTKEAPPLTFSASDEADESEASKTSFKSENNGTDVSEDEKLVSPIKKKVKAEIFDDTVEASEFRR